MVAGLIPIETVVSSKLIPLLAVTIHQAAAEIEGDGADVFDLEDTAQAIMLKLTSVLMLADVQNEQLDTPCLAPHQLTERHAAAWLAHIRKTCGQGEQ